MNTSRTRLQDTLIAAARELTVTHGWGSVRMLDVAKTAGVSRQTVYNEFGDRAGLAEALALNEIERFRDLVRAELFAHGNDARAAVHSTILRVLTEAAANPLVRAILTSADGGDELLPYLTTRAGSVLAVAGAVVREWTTSQLPGLDEHAAALAAESIIRLTVSHIMLPGASPQASADALAEVFLKLLR